MIELANLKSEVERQRALSERGLIAALVEPLHHPDHLRRHAVGLVELDELGVAALRFRDLRREEIGIRVVTRSDNDIALYTDSVMDFVGDPWICLTLAAGLNGLAGQRVFSFAVFSGLGETLDVASDEARGRPVGTAGGAVAAALHQFSGENQSLSSSWGGCVA